MPLKGKKNMEIITISILAVITWSLVIWLRCSKEGRKVAQIMSEPPVDHAPDAIRYYCEAQRRSNDAPN